MDKDILKIALEDNLQGIDLSSISFDLLAKAYILTYNRSIKLKHNGTNDKGVLVVKQARQKALVNVKQNIDETLYEQGIKNSQTAKVLYDYIQDKMMEDDNANIMAVLLCKVNDDSFYNHVLLYNVFINYDYKRNGKSMLDIAAKHGHLEIVKYLLKQDLHMAYHDDKQTPLHYAIRNHHYDVVKLLVNSGKIDINLKDDCGYTVLHYVGPGKNGNVDMFEYLVNHGADINFKYRGKTLLYDAVVENRDETVKYLLSKGANPYIGCGKSDSKNRIHTQHYELCLNIAVNKKYHTIADQVSNYRIIIILSKYMKLIN